MTLTRPRVARSQAADLDDDDLLAELNELTEEDTASSLFADPTAEAGACGERVHSPRVEFPAGRKLLPFKIDQRKLQAFRPSQFRRARCPRRREGNGGKTPDNVTTRAHPES